MGTLPRTRPLGESALGKRDGQSNLVLLGVALLLLGVGAWLLLGGPPQQDSPNDGNLGPAGGNSPDLSSGEFDGPVAPLLGPDKEVVYQGPPDRVFLTHGASNGTIRGRVVAETWVVWPHAMRLTLERQDTREVLQERGASQTEPGFEFEPVPFGNYRLRLQADDCLEQSFLLTLSPESTDHHMAVPLIPSGRIVGRVLSTFSEGVGGLPVVAIRRPDKPGHRSVPTTSLSLEDGSFRIEGLQPGTYDVMAGNQLRPIGEVHVAHLASQAGEAWVTLEVPPLGRAVVTLDFKEGDKARERDWKLLRIQADATAGEGKGFSLSLPVQEDGTATFAALPPGDYAFTAYGGPYRRTMRRGAVAAAQEVAVSIPVRALATGGKR